MNARPDYANIAFTDNGKWFSCYPDEWIRIDKVTRISVGSFEYADGHRMVSICIGEGECESSIYAKCPNLQSAQILMAQLMDVIARNT